MAARFDHPDGSLVFRRAPLRPEYTLELVQAESRSAGGVRFGHDHYAVEDLILLRWRGISTEEANALEDFFRNTVNGMAEEFTFADAEGAACTVRFAAPEIDRTEIAHGRESMAIRLVRIHP